MSDATCLVDVMLSSLAGMNEAERATLISSARGVWERAYPGKHRGREAGKRRWVSGRPLKSSSDASSEKKWLLNRRLRLARALGSSAEGSARDASEIMAASAVNAGEAWTAEHEAAANKLSSSSAGNRKRASPSAETKAKQWVVLKRARQTASGPQPARRNGN